MEFGPSLTMRQLNLLFRAGPLPSLSLVSREDKFKIPVDFVLCLKTFCYVSSAAQCKRGTVLL